MTTEELAFLKYFDPEKASESERDYYYELLEKQQQEWDKWLGENVTNQYERCLTVYLRKCEIEWRAKNIPGGCCIEWLAPMCDDLSNLAGCLRRLGFKIRRIVDEEPWPGETHRWVETTSGIVVYGNTPNSRGFVCVLKQWSD